MSTAPVIDSVQEFLVCGIQHRTHGRLLTARELDAFASIVPVLLKRYDPMGRCIYISEGCKRFTARPREWFIGRSLDNYVGYPPGFIDSLKRSMERVRQTKEIQVFETSLDKPWGSTRWMHNHCPEFDENGEVVSILSVTFDVTERYNAQTRLERTVEEHKHFLAMMAHELRNPLAAVVSGLETLDRSPHESAARSMRGVMLKQLTYITRLISDLLDTARLETGALNYKIEPYQINRSIELACGITESVFKRAGQALYTSFQTHDAVIMGDLSRVAQAVTNLLHNASKFSHVGGRVDLATRVVENVVQIDVTDYASGILPEYQDKIFQKYIRGDEGARSENAGLGLGLYVSREIIRHHGGELALINSSSEGSIFRITLPLDSGATDSKWPYGLPSYSGSSSSITDPEPTARKTDKPLSILVVDDNVAALEILKMLLELEGHTVHTASSAFEGEKMFDAVDPSVVLLDIGLPDLNGRELARKLRAHPNGGGKLFVAVTGWATEEDKKSSFDVGFDAHLTKPVSVDELARLFSQYTVGQERVGSF